jgi:hypothetical protein
MDFKQRISRLKGLFSLTAPAYIEESKIDILPFSFRLSHKAQAVRDIQQRFEGTGFCPLSDDRIEENKRFNYTIFMPERKKKYNKAILLLHGLNERVWDKYLPWAECLAKNTGKPVILFPIAFHMNRAPELWSNPRRILPWVKARKEESPDTPNTTFANVALSSRIAKDPLRFSCSGIETIFNIEQLMKEMKEGKHPMFCHDTSVNIFAYSIGAMVSQVALIANEDDLFSDTKLFMFCGGSLMSDMNGSSRDIMDSESYLYMQRYYMEHFINHSTAVETPNTASLADSFRIMIREDRYQSEREALYSRLRNRVRALTLRKDSVIPTIGVKKACGSHAGVILEELDFPYPYTHQIPFPTIGKVSDSAVNHAFASVFSRACTFL